MNRRDFLLAGLLIPSSIGMLKITKFLHAQSLPDIPTEVTTCEECLPLCLDNPVRTPYTPSPGECDDSPFPCGETDPDPTGIALKSFYAEPFSLMDFIRSLFK